VGGGRPGLGAGSPPGDNRRRTGVQVKFEDLVEDRHDRERFLGTTRSRCSSRAAQSLPRNARPRSPFAPPRGRPRPAPTPRWPLGQERGSRGCAQASPRSSDAWVGRLRVAQHTVEGVNVRGAVDFSALSRGYPESVDARSASTPRWPVILERQFRGSERHRMRVWP
jgi:hypothetical protein